MARLLRRAAGHRRRRAGHSAQHRGAALRAPGPQPPEGAPGTSLGGRLVGTRTHPDPRSGTDRRVSPPRPSQVAPRPARPVATGAHAGAGARLPPSQPSRSGHRVRHRLGAVLRSGCAARAAARHRGGVGAHLLRHPRRRIHAHHRRRRAAVGARTPRIRARPAGVLRRGEIHHPRPPERRRGPGATPPRPLSGHQAVRSRRRGVLDLHAARSLAASWRTRLRGDGDRHGPPRAAERAGQHPRQGPEGPVRRVRGRDAGDGPQRRREVPPGLLVQRHDAGRRDALGAGVQSLALGNRRAGGRRFRARPPGPTPRLRRRQGGAAHRAWRCGLRRPGRGDGNAADVADARLRGGRHGSRHRQQPDRLHDPARRGRPLHRVLLGDRQARAGAHPARQRRRPGGVRLRHPAGGGLPNALQEGHRDRLGVLSAARPQRGRGSVQDAAAHVPEDRSASHHAHPLRRAPGRRGRRPIRGNRRHGGPLPFRPRHRRPHGALAGA